VFCFSGFSATLYAENSNLQKQSNETKNLSSSNTNPYITMYVENTFKIENGKYKYMLIVTTHNYTSGTHFDNFVIKTSSSGSILATIQYPVNKKYVEYFYSGSSNYTQTFYFYTSKMYAEVYIKTTGTRVYTYDKEWLSINDYRKSTAVRAASISGRE